MKLENNERIKEVLGVMDKKRREDSLKLLRKLDKNISKDLAKDLLNAWERFGDGFIPAIGKK